jgi:DNA-directed RNA polymerase sigma subunit (sigma70/sigma32)
MSNPGLRRVERLRQKVASPEFRERVRQAARRRSRPHAEDLTGLAAEGFDELPARERHLVRQYYGLDGPPQTLAELASGAGLAKTRVRVLIARSVEQFMARQRAQSPARRDVTLVP